MAKAILQKSGVANLGSKFISQIRSSSLDSLIIPSILQRRSVHASIYDKNREEHFHPTLVPNHVISSEPQQYWGPNSQTGVFGPATDNTLSSSNFQFGGTENSVLEQKVFFRSQENLDKPIEHY